MNKREEILNNNDVVRNLKSIAQSSFTKDARLILYGSRARGDARPDSDWDLLIIVNQTMPLSFTDCGMLTDAFLEYGWNNNIEINPLVFTSKQWEKQQHTLFYHNIQQEGVILWA